MAEILIKGMEMPKSCDDCTMKCALFELYYGMDELEGERHPNCPFIELPPHGDLKDVDKVITEIKGWYCEDVYAFIHELEIAPTVVPASEGE